MIAYFGRTAVVIHRVATSHVELQVEVYCLY